MTPEQARPKRRRGFYLLPNLFTPGTLFGGFYAIVAAMNGDWEKASIAIFAAMVFDSLDGFIARKTHTASDFGKEYDSLCDMVAFGVAASLVMYAWSLHFLSQYKWLGGKLGWVAAFTYTACAALRSEEHTSELQSRFGISYAVFFFKKKTKHNTPTLPSYVLLLSLQLCSRSLS